MKVMVTGTSGQLGYDMIRALVKETIECRSIGERSDLDLRDFNKTKEVISSYLPDIVIHCAAYTNVDQAEKEEGLCRLINVDVTENIAQICKSIDATLVYVSTDYVFSGKGSIPYEVNSVPEPISVYGRSKLDGERKVTKHLNNYFIVRTSWAFGINGNNFIRTMLNVGKNKETIDVVCDQFGSPTYTWDLANLIIKLIRTKSYGTYHATNEGFCSWADLAVEVFKQVGMNTKVNFIPSRQYYSFAQRPSNSRLSKSSLDKAQIQRLPNWKNAVHRYLEELRSNENENRIDQP